MSKKLKPCPFCGGQAELEEKDYNGSAKWLFEIHCAEGCVSMMNLYGPKKDAVDRWNKRIKIK